MPDLGPFELPSIVNPENKKPAVSITSPVSGTEFFTTDKIIIQSSASDEDGTVSRVELLMGTNLMAVMYAAPYQFEWVNPVAGSYTIFARAYDNEGAASISDPINIRVKTTGGAELGAKQKLLQLTGTSYTDGVQNKSWSTANSVSFSNSHIKLTYSSSKGGTIISPEVDMSKYQPDSLMLTFASSGGGNRNLNIYFSSDGGTNWSGANVQAGAANGVSVPVKMKISDKVNGTGMMLIKLEAANTIEVWNVEMNGYEKIKSHINPVPMLLNNIRCLPTITTGFLVLSMELMQTMPVQIDLYNLQGQRISSIDKQIFPAGNNKVMADISQNPAGMYFVRFSTDSETVSLKIVKR
jgi:hypothetical protein